MRYIVSILAIVAGFMTTAILVMLTTAIAVKLRASDKKSPRSPGSAYLTANLVLSFLSAFVGGYICAWIAPTYPLVHASILAAIFLMLSLYMAVTTGAQPGQPAWYPWIIGIVCAAGIVSGGILRID